MYRRERESIDSCERLKDVVVLPQASELTMGSAAEPMARSSGSTRLRIFAIDGHWLSRNEGLNVLDVLG